MNRKFCIFAIVISLTLFSACSSTSGSGEEVVFDDGYKTNESGEIIIEERDLQKNDGTLADTVENKETTTTLAADGSRITVMYDASGNKTETRYFYNDSRIKYLLLRTSVNGQREIFIFGKRGQTRSLPEEMLDKALSSPADELANVAGISPNTGKTYSRTFSGVTTAPKTPTFQPLPQTQALEEPKPQTEMRQEPEPADTKNDTVEETKPPTKPTANLQNYLPKKPKDAATENPQ